MNKTDEILDRLRGQQPVIDNPEELTDLIMSSLTPRPLQGERELKRRVFPLFWRGIGGGLIAAGIALLIAFHYNNKVEPTQQPVVAEVVQPESPQPVREPASEPVIEEKQEPQAPQPAAQPVRPKMRVKIQESAEEPLLAEAETMQEEVPTEEPMQEEAEQEYLPVESDPFLLAVVEAQDIRARGERLYEEVAQKKNNH